MSRNEASPITSDDQAAEGGWFGWLSAQIHAASPDDSAAEKGELAPYRFVAFGTHSPGLRSATAGLTLAMRHYYDVDLEWRLEGNVYLCETLERSRDNFGVVRREKIGGSSKGTYGAYEGLGLGRTLQAYRKDVLATEPGLVNRACAGDKRRKPIS